MSTSRWSLLGLVVTLGCPSPLHVGLEDLPLLQTDKSEYAFTEVRGWPRLSIEFEFVNRTRRTLHLKVGCGSLFFDRLEDGEWVEAWGGGACLGLDVPIVLASGEAYQGTIGASLRSTWQAGPHRLRAAVTEDLNGESVPLRLRVSNTFEVVLMRTPSA